MSAAIINISDVLLYFEPRVVFENLSFLDEEEVEPKYVSKFAKRTPSPEPEPIPENVDVLDLLRNRKTGPRRKRKVFSLNHEFSPVQEIPQIHIISGNLE